MIQSRINNKKVVAVCLASTLFLLSAIVYFGFNKLIGNLPDFITSTTVKTPTMVRFRMTMVHEPRTFHPHQAALSANSNLLINLYRGLYKYSAQGLVLEAAEHCQRRTLRLKCRLDPRVTWSDGSIITAEDFIRSFRELMTQRHPATENLLHLKNAQAILQSDKPVDTLGVISSKPNEIEFVFATEDPEFEFKLTHIALSPLKHSSIAGQTLFNGPYQLDSTSPTRVILVSNPFYQKPQRLRPTLEVLKVDDESSALRLYDANLIDFYRITDSSLFHLYEEGQELHKVIMARFDYVGFSDALPLSLRKALFYSLDFSSFQRLFHTSQPPGCPSLPRTYYDEILCYKYDLESARRWLAESRQSIPRLEFYFVPLSSPILTRMAEWFQGQWKKHLDLFVELKPIEFRALSALLQTKPPTIFRKGVPLNRPTCRSALEIWHSRHPENVLHLQLPKLDQLLRHNRILRTEDCSLGIKLLSETFKILPLGEFAFHVLVKPQWKGWHLSELNQLDLTDLEPVGIN